MKSPILGSRACASLMGLSVGALAGVAAALLWAPLSGRQLRASLRSRADVALDRGLMLLEEGRRAFQTARSGALEPAPLKATLGEIAQMHPSSDFANVEARS